MPVPLDPDVLAEYNRIQSTIEKLKHSAVEAIFAVNSRQAIFRLRCKSNLFKTLEVRPQSLELPNPNECVRFRGATIENVCYVSDAKKFPMRKIKLELDVLTGHATLSFD